MFNIVNYYFLVEVTLEGCINEISTLVTNLDPSLPLDEIFGNIGKKESHCVISDLEASESILKKLENLLKFFRGENASTLRKELLKLR